MRTKSAFFAILLAVTAGTTLTISACTDDSTAPAPAKDDAQVVLEKKAKELEDTYGWMGQYHTDGMEFVFRKLKENSSKSKPEPVCKVAAKAVKEFHKTARKGELPLYLVDPSLDAEVCPSDNGKSPNKNVLVGSPRVTRAVLSPEASSHIDRIETAINSATSRAALLNSLRTIQYSAIASLSQYEAGAITGIISIAISSMDYWEANLDAWVAMPGVIHVPYVRAAEPGNTVTGNELSLVTPRWWTHPAVRAYLRIVAADAIGAARVIYATWSLGPIGWDAAAAAAVWSSTTMTLSILF